MPVIPFLECDPLAQKKGYSPGSVARAPSLWEAHYDLGLARVRLGERELGCASIAKAKRLLGYAPRYTTEQIYYEAIEHLLESGQLKVAG